MRSDLELRGRHSSIHAALLDSANTGDNDEEDIFDGIAERNNDLGSQTTDHHSSIEKSGSLVTDEENEKILLEEQQQ